MVHLIVSELGYYKAAQTLNNLHESGRLDDSLFKDILDELFSEFINEYAGDTVTVEKFSSYLVRGV